ncbi:MAG: acetyl-CoA carboxylase biotin carboxyl carrier protein [bacterium]|nr:acetyl-CoA carboxylase biotin carboxyl carrier protein [bacterium]
MSHEDVRSILQAIGNATVDEFRLETGDLKIVIRKRGAAGNASPSSESQGATTDDPVAEAPEAASAKPARPARPDLPSSGVAVKAPMLGVFYRSPAPGAPPFVEVGGIVSEQDTLCIIEVMKLMNSIKAGARGRIAAILVDDAAMVEYDQPLMIIEPVQ